jgi:hypothetical protein
MNQELEEPDYYVNMNRVMELYLKGTINPTTISKALSLPRKDVLNYIDTWKEIAKNNPAIKDRAAEVLQNFDRSTDMIIEKMWTVVDDGTVDLKTKASTLKQIHDIDSKRQETLQKAGMYDDAGIADELVAMEEYVEGIKQALFATIKEYPHTKTFIMEQLSGAGKPVSVDSETVVSEVVK